MSKIEQTLSIIKPDAMERNLEEKIKNIFIKNNFEIIKEKKVKLEKRMLNYFKFMKLNRFTTIFVIICHLDLF